MKPSRTDPEYMRDLEVLKLLQDQNWRDGLIGDPTYLRSIMILGYSDLDARTELSLLKLKLEQDGRRRKG